MAADFVSTTGVGFYLVHTDFCTLQAIAEHVSTEIEMEIWYSEEDALSLHEKLSAHKDEEVVAEFLEFLVACKGFIVY